LHSNVAQSSKAEQTGAKQGSSAADSPAAAASPAAPALTQLCLLVDVTASKLKRVGRYNLGRVVGRGSFGVVRLGQNTQTGAVPNGSCQIAVHNDRLCDFIPLTATRGCFHNVAIVDSDDACICPSP